jgi:hypothetical protein
MQKKPLWQKFNKNILSFCFFLNFWPASLIFLSSFFKFYFIVIWVGVHCGFYKGSYNILNMSYLNSLPPPFFFIPNPHSWNSFNRYLFLLLQLCIHSVCIIFTFLHNILTSSPPTSINATSPGRTCSALLFSDYAKERKRNDIFAYLR